MMVRQRSPERALTVTGYVIGACWPEMAVLPLARPLAADKWSPTTQLTCSERQIHGENRVCASPVRLRRADVAQTTTSAGGDGSACSTSSAPTPRPRRAISSRRTVGLVSSAPLISPAEFDALWSDPAFSTPDKLQFVELIFGPHDSPRALREQAKMVR